VGIETGWSASLYKNNPSYLVGNGLVSLSVFSNLVEDGKVAERTY
jgi:hypothetical protein